MIVQSAPMIMKQRNQPSRECLYAWYPEVVPDTNTSTTMGPRDIYIHKGIDKDLIQQNSQINPLNNFSNDDEVIQRYKQSTAPSERIYQSNETLDEALRTPWALHYEVKRRPATPNFPSNSTELSKHEEIPRRLKSAPAVRSLPPASVLTIPEPQFITPILPVTTNQISETTTQIRPRTRATSAKARLNTTFPIANETINEEFKQQQRREIRSAQGFRPKDEIKTINDDTNQTSVTQVYTDTIQQQQEPLYIPATPPPPPPPGYVYQQIPSRPSTGTTASGTSSYRKAPLRTTIEVNPIALNPFYIHRPGVVAVCNTEKKPVIRETSASKKSHKHHRRIHHHQQRRHEKHQTKPLLALTPITQTITKLPVEINGIKLAYDPTLTVDDSSSNSTKYLIEGRLYLIKDQRYNVIENVDPTFIEKYNQTLTLPSRPKYYQTIPIDKLQIPKPVADIHYNASETYFYNTIPKRVQRYVIDPNFISENLNVNKMSLSKRPSSTGTVIHSTTAAVNDFNRPSTTVYA